MGALSFEENMKKLPVEIQMGIKVIPIITDTEPCKKCLFNGKKFEDGCMHVNCKAFERIDENSVYFIEADSVVPEVTIPVQTYKSEKRTLANSAAVIVHTTSGKVLTTTRRNTDILALPGGKQDPGETILQTIVRETAEETGIRLRPEFFIPVFSEIVVGSDGRDFYCTTFVYKIAIDETWFDESWFVEDGIKVSFQTWENLYTGAFVEYNKKAEENFRRWQATQ